MILSVRHEQAMMRKAEKNPQSAVCAAFEVKPHSVDHTSKCVNDPAGSITIYTPVYTLFCTPYVFSTEGNIGLHKKVNQLTPSRFIAQFRTSQSLEGLTQV